MCRPVDKRRSRRKRWTLLVSHISLYPSFVVVVHFCSQSMLPHISSPVVIVYLFLCARDREFRKNIKKRERARLPISFLMSVSYLGVVNTHTVFSLVSHRISSERTKKTEWCRMCVCVHTHTKRKKEEGRIFTRSENGNSSIGIKKSRIERERKR